MKLWEILVPTKMNGGTPIELPFHQEWDAKVAAISGGLTILTEVVGQWRSPNNELFRETMITVRVACTKEDMRKIADITAEHCRQEAVCHYPVADNVVTVNYGERHTNYALCVTQDA